jgi:lysine-N-methylase
LTATDPSIREIAGKSIKKIKADRSSQNHSYVQMNPQTAACPFLQADKLCMIQGKMGESALSKVCTTYPRHSGSISGRQIEVATLSCPEAARLCLLDPDAMNIGDAKISSADDFSIRANPSNLRATSYLHQTVVELLQDKRVSMLQSVLIYATALNLMFKRGETVFSEENRFDQMNRIITLVNASFGQNQEDYAETRAALSFQLGKILPIIIRHARSNLQRNNRFIKSVFDGLNGLELDPEKLALPVEKYMSAVNGLLPDDRNQVASAFRNYLLNDLVKNVGYYVRSPDDALRSLQAAVTRLSIIAVQVFGAKALDASCNLSERLVLAVSSTARAFEHNPAIMIEIAKYLDAIEEKSVAVLALITPRI